MRFKTKRIELAHKESEFEVENTEAGRPGRRSLGATACLSLGLGMLAIGLVTLVTGTNATQENRPTPLTPASLPTSELETPPIRVQVAPEGLVMMDSKYTRRYHWRNDCAVQRPPYHATAIWGHDEMTRLKYLKSKQILLTRRRAEARGATPCLYCSELGAPNLRLAVRVHPHRVHPHRVHAHRTPQVTHTAGNASRSLGYGPLFNEVMR